MLSKGKLMLKCSCRKLWFSTSSMSQKVVIHKEVSEALLKNRPIVALESTIITHGMPFPQNLKTAKSVIEIIRRNGCVPATVAVFNEEIHVGLTRSELEFIAKTGRAAMKTSRRDISVALSKGLVGGTTVSGTMVAATKAGIPVFVTGGIGGVHRGAETSFDISADLVDLGRTPIAVVCAGVKSILDIGKTLEYLETRGVTVAAFGETPDFPAFFSPKSGYQAPHNVRTAKEAAAIIDCNLELELNSGMLFAVPIPESHAPLGSEIEQAIQQALEEARKQDINGKDITPFVLQKVNEITSGKSLDANIALIQNNAAVGSQIAVELCRLRETKVFEKYHMIKDLNKRSSTNKKQLVVIGGSNVDFTAKASSDIVYYGATNIGHIQQSFGGVGRNIAECIGRISDDKPLFISAVGGDDLGEMLLRHLESIRVSTYGVHVSKGKPTSTYSVVLNKHGEVVVAVGGMEVHDEITMQLISAFEEPIRRAPMVILDGNIDQDVIGYCMKLCRTHKIPVMFEPTCLMKAAKPFTNHHTWQSITMTTPNLGELRTMYQLVTTDNNGEIPAWSEDTAISDKLEDILKECVTLSQPLMKYISTIIITLGQHGLVVCRDVPANTPFLADGKVERRANGRLMSAVHYPTLVEQNNIDIVSVNGAGDCFTAAFSSSVVAGHAPDICIKAGLLASWYSLQSSVPVSAHITPEHFTAENVESWSSWEPRVLAIP